MKAPASTHAIFIATLLSSASLFAQSGPMRAPSVPRAIESHLEQSRTLQQREAIAAEQAKVAGHDAAAQAPPPSASKKPVAKKRKKTAKPAFAG